MASPSIFVTAYKEELKELKTNERAKLKLLRDLAFENERFAPEVVQAITEHIYTSKKELLLPALFLLDFIMKCAKSADRPPSKYPSLIEKNLPEVFAFVWDKSDTRTRETSLRKTLGTWKDVVPTETYETIQAIIPAPPAAAPLPAPAPARAPITVKGARGPTVALQGVVKPPAFPVQQPQPAVSTVPQFTLGANGQYQVVQGSGIPIFTQQALLQQAMQAAQVRPDFGGVLYPPATVPQPSLLPSVPVSTALPGMTAAALASSLASIIPSTRPAPVQPAAVAPSALPVQKVAQLQPAAAPASPQVASQPRSPSQPPVAPATPKDTLSGLVDSLCEASQRTKAKFMDLKFVRNRRLQENGPRSRSWFMKVDQWLEGTKAAEDQLAQPMDDQENDQQGATAVQSLVEEDPSQPRCAISGEKFESTFDPETNKWYYEDAIVLTGEDAAKFNLMDGAIVKVSSLSGVKLSGQKRKSVEDGGTQGAPACGTESRSSDVSVPQAKRIQV